MADGSSKEKQEMMKERKAYIQVFCFMEPIDSCEQQVCFVSDVFSTTSVATPQKTATTKV